uniref:Uncharacterized protein n=1 Tax=Zea mays TaxID=4577 RepID=C4J267_MAIZE|nr:unknown [Zea mays]
MQSMEGAESNITQTMDQRVHTGDIAFSPLNGNNI